MFDGYEDDLLELRRYLGKSVHYSDQPVLEELLLSLKGTVGTEHSLSEQEFGVSVKRTGVTLQFNLSQTTTLLPFGCLELHS